MTDDDVLIEAMARIIAGDIWPLKIDFDLAEECLSVCRPVIERETRERCVGIVQKLLKFADTTSEADIAIIEALRAAAIRETGDE